MPFCSDRRVRQGDLRDRLAPKSLVLTALRRDVRSFASAWHSNCFSVDRNPNRDCRLVHQSRRGVAHLAKATRKLATRKNAVGHKPSRRQRHSTARSARTKRPASQPGREDRSLEGRCERRFETDVGEDFDGFEDDEVEEVAEDAVGGRRDRREPSRSSTSAARPSRIDDPVRMYLMQMGEIPLLTREPKKSPRAKQHRSAPAPASATACWPATSCCKAP